MHGERLLSDRQSSRVHVRTVLLLVSVAALILCSSGCATLSSVERPEVQAVHPRITGIDFQGVDLAFDVDVDNPYPVPIRTPRFRYGVDIEGSRFFASETTSKLDLPANGVGAVTLPIRVSYSDLFRTYKGLADVPEAAYRLHGALVVPVLGRSFELPVSHDGTFPILRPPIFSDVRLQVADASLTKAKIGVDAAMKNPNIFALGIKDLGYVVKLGDLAIGGLAATTGDALGAGQSGRVSLSGEVSAASAIFSLLQRGGPGGANIVPSGFVQTPYGAVRLTD